jgi:hypothetical protein
MANTIAMERFEKRIPMAIAVHISGHRSAPGVEKRRSPRTSVHAARAFSVRRWRLNEMLEIASLPGDFRAKARVAYCQSQSEGFVIGLEF